MADVLLSTLTGSSVIKSIQRGTVVVGANSLTTVSISTIDPSKAVLSLLGFTYGGGNVTSAHLSGLTSVSFQVSSASGGSPAPSVSWQVVEYY